MAKCIKCGRGGLFRPINSNGLCIGCVTSELSDVSAKVNEISNKLSKTESDLEKAESQLTPEILKYVKEGTKIAELSEKRKQLSSEISSLKSELKNIKEELIIVNEEVLAQNFGLYTPVYNFDSSEKYKERLKTIRDQEKEMIKSHSAAELVGYYNERTTLRPEYIGKLMLRAFNAECDELISKVKYNNFDVFKKRIEKSYEEISGLGTTRFYAISKDYYDLKMEELMLAYEYAQKKQEEKENAKIERERLREEAKLLKEIEEERKKLQKEQSHYANALEKIEAQLQSKPDDPDLLSKKRELEEQAEEIEKAIKDVDYREANKRAGYVYIISNIGAFGENIYKIGMTRRLDPQERIDELGGASVPFNFDVHALIFTEDAPSLEAALHRAFENKKVNMVNQRREFFYVTLDEIKEVVRQNYDKTVEFVDIPAAEQYRISLKMKQ